VVVLNHGAWLASDSIVARLFSTTHAGSAAVLGFFALSGFILSEAASTFYRGRPLAFAANRFLKIVPAFLAALVLSIAVHAHLDRQGTLAEGLKFEGYGSVPPLWKSSNLLYNPLSIVPSLMPERVVDRIGEVYLFVRYIWAVNVEMLFYIFVAVFIVARKIRPFRVTALMVGVATLAYAAYFLETQWAGRTPYAFYSPLFFLGVCMLNWRAGRHWAFATLVAGVLSLLTAASLIGGLPISAILKHPGSLTPGILGGTAIFGSFIAVLAVLAYGPWMPLQKKMDRRLGDLSYALYLNQYAVLVVFSAFVPPSAHGLAMWLLVLGASVLTAAVLQYLIEQPIAALRARVRGQPLA
jgi:peptidoglycan/LPS O-acetylase OafA/YrhL